MRKARLLKGSKCLLFLSLHLGMCQIIGRTTWSGNLFGALSFTVSLKLADFKTETDGEFVLPLDFICVSI